MAKKIWFLAVVLLLSFLVTTNWQQISSTATSSLNVKEDYEQPIVLGYSNWAGWWPWAIAESEGLFAKHNANVELKWYDNYSKSMQDLADGYIDANCQTLNDTITFAEDAVKGEVVVLVNDNSAGNDKIIAAKGINEVKDLKNKQVVLEAGVVDDFLLTLALEKEGMSRSDVKIIDIETGAAAEAFAVGQADAVGAFPPFWLIALKREGAKEITSSKAFPGAIPDLLVVTEQLIDSNPEQVQALIDTWFDVLDFMAVNPTRADEIMAKRANVSYEELQLFKAGTKMFNLEENFEAFADGNNMRHMPYAARKMTNFLQHSLKSIDKKPNLDAIFNQSFIKAYAINKQ
ncbi:ABC transporter substrate-binding protein [Pleurocapsa sp. PCC 7319]|uniref:ABC transporter substrate-binding protein n=1 Tax=Pleurocapsa sp. PCC 7319 TaxID=118161 RepID=UPI000347B3CD|nr:ABC transporter substrate-binding protein [Pleurocapsa sp. PCC 7319]